MKTIQIKLTDLQRLVEIAQSKLLNDSDLTGTIEIEVLNYTDSYSGSDNLEFWLKSAYSECNSKFIYKV